MSCRLYLRRLIAIGRSGLPSLGLCLDLVLDLGALGLGGERGCGFVAVLVRQKAVLEAVVGSMRA